MTQESNTLTDKRQFVNAVFIPLVLVILMVLSFILEKGMDWDFHTAGVYPRRIENIWGVFTLIFVHAGWSHLINNIISFFILGSFLYFFYKQIASRVMILSYVFSGLILWFIGRDSWHIGASGLIYSLAFFLFFSGIIRKHVPLIAISLIVAFIYGSMVWHIFPWQIQDPVSWEGHLAGGITGSVLSLWYRNDGPQKPVKVWENEEDESLDYLNENDEEIENEQDQQESKPA
ncbi:MAG: rhomboid family intramembrane serine protease [Bacteroidota bacterium]|nr:rhomboid family intramembrane serine protease [Bacteroidota bacterium]